MTVGDSGMGPQGGYVTRLVVILLFKKNISEFLLSFDSLRNFPYNLQNKLRAFPTLNFFKNFLENQTQMNDIRMLLVT